MRVNESTSDPISLVVNSNGLVESAFEYIISSNYSAMFGCISDVILNGERIMGFYAHDSQNNQNDGLVIMETGLTGNVIWSKLFPFQDSYIHSPSAQTLKVTPDGGFIISVGEMTWNSSENDDYIVVINHHLAQRKALLSFR